MITAVMFIANSCAEDVPTYTTETYVGCNNPDITQIQVVACDETQSNYFGAAEVFMYLSDAARTADGQRNQQIQKALTDNVDPINVGAVFYQTAFQKYYFFVRRETSIGSGNFLTGTGEGYPEMCKSVKIPIIIKP
jgi:hypothetical protein